jgi:Ni,Fe-hydrogenase III small subunit
MTLSISLLVTTDERVIGIRPVLHNVAGCPPYPGATLDGMGACIAV